MLFPWVRNGRHGDSPPSSWAGSGHYWFGKRGSRELALLCRMPQGLVLSLLRVNNYVHWHKARYHQYADDSLWCSLDPDPPMLMKFCRDLDGEKRLRFTSCKNEWLWIVEPRGYGDFFVFGPWWGNTAANRSSAQFHGFCLKSRWHL